MKSIRLNRKLKINYAIVFWKSAVKYYTQYLDGFPNGDYEETVLYNLVVIYKDVDKSKAKIYAKKLSDNYQF